ncbi:hypothetical protein OIU77_019542 [Salix suchowensis]|uniref:Uncharacterized protein n=1 Tax=Salix suchowensis TaxID=1278906 RepID=A0ABQ9CHD7_9ROSI|nr:hypothetical protein OIU77_019542 [Salix suchowensis]
MQEKSSKGDLTGIENNINSVCSGMISESKFNDGRNHGGCPVIPFLNEQMHLVENNITGSPKCTIREEESEGGLLTISGNEQSFDLKGNVIKVTNGTINVVNHNEVLCHKNNEFGSEIDLSDYGMCDSTLEKLRQGRSSGNRPSNNEQFHDDENSESCFLFVGNQHTLTAKDNATGSFNGTMDELKQNMDYVETVLSLSSVAPVQSVEKNLDTAFTGVNSRGAKVQASGFFPLYDAVPDKGESELFGSTYGVLSGFEGLKSGGMENMDYNLLTS